MLDSNLIIYAARPEHSSLRALIARVAPAVSAVSYVEVLGYHRLSEVDRRLFEAFFAAATIHPLSSPVLEQAVKLRQLRKMTLGDALVAATALVHNLTLLTHNTTDFQWVPGLTVEDPLAPSLTGP